MNQTPSQAELVAAEAGAPWAALLLGLYLLVMLVFLWQTFREGEAAGGRWDLARFAGLLLCGAWPLLLLLVGIFALFNRPAQEEHGPAPQRPPAPQAVRGSGRIVLFGIPILDQPFDAAVALTASMTRAGGRSTVFFVNAHTLNLASQSPGYSAVLRQADAVFGDGTGVRWAARMRGHRLAANLNGTDLVPALLGSQRGLRCFILGSTAERIGRIGEDFEKRFPDVVLVGTHHGYLDASSSAGVIAQINAARPDLLLVGMGNPIQEEWICRHREALDVPLAIAVGGLFEYWSGMLDRAPTWMRRLGIEWLHILRRQPWKARRYLVGNFEFMWRSLSWRSLDLRNQAR